MSDNLRMDPQIIFCDMCTGEDRKPARKSCMKCEISMCIQHLEAHLNTPVLLQTHPLTEPMDLSGTTKCPQHGKLLEYYCLDDMTCVCVSCAIEDQHRLHNMKTFATAHKELLEKLKAEQQALQVITKDKSESLEKWEKSERQKLSGCSLRLIEAVTALRDISLTSVQSSVSARMVSIKTSKNSMQAAQAEKDTFRFLQMYSQVHQDVERAKAVDLKKGLEPGSERDKLVREINQVGEQMMQQAGEFWCSLLTLVDPENHQKPFASSSDLFFEPQNLGSGMSLSEDKRTIFYCGWMWQRSTQFFHIQSRLPTPEFKRWVISLPKDYDWSTGLCDASYAKGLRAGEVFREVFGLRFQGEQLMSLTTEYSVPRNAHRPLKQSQYQIRVKHNVINLPDEDMAETMPRLQKIEVVWKDPGSLSFFSWIGQHKRIKLLTIMILSKSWGLGPFVRLEEDGLQKSNKFSSRSSYGASSSVQQQCQKEWKCPCGKVYTDSNNGCWYRGHVYEKASKATCTCGGPIGFPPVTEVLCELL